MTKKKRKKENTKNFLAYIALGLAAIAIVLSSIVGGYYFGYADAKTEIAKKAHNDETKRLSMLQKLEDITSIKSIKSEESVNKRLKKVLKKDVKVYANATHEYKDETVKKPPKRVDRVVKISSSKPKLAIIIDDICIKSHIKAIKSLGLPITMSFLPPSKARPNSAKLAAKEKFYMVHLPMEAKSFNAEEDLTLRVSDSDSKISEIIKNIKKAFPKVAYINNHTGSKFTADELAMNRLIYTLQQQNIKFIDSRTTHETKAPKVMKNFGLRYVARDVFLDHALDKASIKKAIKKAIKIAKLHGTAIAIGHPHANTFTALLESKKLFDEVELVYINKLY